MPQHIDIQDLLIWAFHHQRVESRLHADPDAMTVYWAVLALPAPHATVISRCAREAAAPDWRASTRERCVCLDEVRRSRRLYSEWIRAMVVLKSTLNGSLEQFVVHGPRLAEQPWLQRQLSA
jgi:hypothetical protein